MTNKKSTKKALLMSALSLLLCMSMLVGTTFAWFTDEVKSGNNIIAAGNLDIELYHSDRAVKNEKVNGGTKLFDDVSSQLWEPGAVAYEVLTVVNEGTLALKYNLAFHALNATVVNGKSLANVLKIAVVDASKLTSREAAIAAGADKWTALDSFDLPGVLEAEESETYGIVIYWEPSSNDNDFNMNNENQGKILSVELGVHLTATQKMSEEDSFGDDYDKDAEPVLVENAADLAAALTANEEYIYVILGNDIDLPITSLGTITAGSGEYKLGGENTKAIHVDLNGRKLNITTTYWSNLGAKNDDAVITFANGTMTSSQATGTWNSYDLTFSNCKFAFENVTFEKAIALESSAVLKNVTINETHDYYAMWIAARGQTVEIDGLTINSNGRGIKIDEQYVGTPAEVTLKVSNATFNTNKKAAIMVKSAAGADIILDKIDISNTSDPLHAVWVDEESAAYSDKVNVIGGKKFSEADVISSATGLNDAIVRGDTDIVLGAGTYTFPASGLKAGQTLICTPGTVFEGNSKLNINGATVIGATFSNPTGTVADQTINGVFKDCVFEGNNGLRWCYAGDTVVFENCIFSGDVYGVHFDGGANDIIFKNCTFSGFNAIGGVVTLAKYEGCTFVANGKSGYNGINMWGNTEMTNCTFVFDGTAGTEWVDAVGSNMTYTFTNCIVTDGETEKGIETVVGNYGVGNTIIINGKTLGLVSDEVVLDADLAAGKDVVMTGDMKFNASETTANSGYGATGVSVMGGVLDGNGHSLGINNWGTWDAAVHTTGGTIKNLTINSGMRGIFMGSATADVYIDNVTIDGTIYTFNSDGGSKEYGVYISNSTLNGWTSHSDVHKEVVYTNCEFGEGQGYASCRPYGPTKFIGCNFSEGFTVDPIGAVVFENCTINGEPLTAENLSTLVTGGIANATVIG